MPSRFSLKNETLNPNRSLQQYAETPKQKHAGGYTERNLNVPSLPKRTARNN